MYRAKGSRERQVRADEPVLIFDFDGTICLGDGPVRAYADRIAAITGDTSIVAELVGVDYGRQPLAGGRRARDGYDAVRMIAESRGIAADIQSTAYMQSRETLADQEIYAPRGLKEFLAQLPAQIVLATNAPAIGLDDALVDLGLYDSFNVVFSDVGKPAGLAQILADEYMAASVLSIGDIWELDLAPVASVGKHTALVGQFSQVNHHARPTMRANTLDQLYPSIERWLARTVTTHSERNHS